MRKACIFHLCYCTIIDSYCSGTSWKCCRATPFDMFHVVELTECRRQMLFHPLYLKSGWWIFFTRENQRNMRHRHRIGLKQRPKEWWLGRTHSFPGACWGICLEWDQRILYHCTKATAICFVPRILRQPPIKYTNLWQSRQDLELFREEIKIFCKVWSYSDPVARDVAWIWD